MSEFVQVDKSTYEKLVAAANQMQQAPGAASPTPAQAAMPAQPAQPQAMQPQQVVMVQPAAPVQPQAQTWSYNAGPAMFGLPQQTPSWSGTAWTGPMPQPTGVSVPVTVPLQDGRELSVRIHFGPEAAGNLQALGALAEKMFGAWLQARNGWSQRNYSNRRRSW